MRSSQVLDGGMDGGLRRSEKAPVFAYTRTLFHRAVTPRSRSLRELDRRYAPACHQRTHSSHYSGTQRPAGAAARTSVQSGGRCRGGGRGGMAAGAAGSAGEGARTGAGARADRAGAARAGAHAEPRRPGERGSRPRRGGGQGASSGADPTADSAGQRPHEQRCSVGTLGTSTASRSHSTRLVHYRSIE